MKFTHPKPWDEDRDQLRRAMRGLPAVCPDDWELVVTVLTNGVRHVRGKCTTCEKLSVNSIAHSKVERIDQLPVERDDTARIRCDHCGHMGGGVERHHWAPRAIFPDPEQWPTANLCRQCHQLWHRTMNRWRVA